MIDSVFRIAAFTTNPAGGNPAGVWVGDAFPDPETMRSIAAEVGYSETAFIVPRHGSERTVRYFSAEAEVSFCGHATIASGYVLGELEGDAVFELQTSAGPVRVDVESRGGIREVALTSVVPRHEAMQPGLLEELLGALDWSMDELGDAIPAARAYAGAWHAVIASRTLERLNRLEYDFERLKAIMQHEGLTTLQLVYRESERVFHARNPFPVGGVYEDPATGAAAAALGGYLRDAGLIAAPVIVLVRQGEAMGRPSRISVEIPVSGGIVVRGSAVGIPLIRSAMAGPQGLGGVLRTADPLGHEPANPGRRLQREHS
jgi:PhzF family phenazine biosynthesis protein